jgi:hypothetical protein
MSRAQDVDEPFSQRAAAQVLQAKRLSDRWNHEGRVLLAVRGRTELAPGRVVAKSIVIGFSTSVASVWSDPGTACRAPTFGPDLCIVDSGSFSLESA